MRVSPSSAVAAITWRYSCAQVNRRIMAIRIMRSLGIPVDVVSLSPTSHVSSTSFPLLPSLATAAEAEATSPAYQRASADRGTAPMLPATEAANTAATSPNEEPVTRFAETQGLFAPVLGGHSVIAFESVHNFIDPSDGVIRKVSNSFYTSFSIPRQWSLCSLVSRACSSFLVLFLLPQLTLGK